MRRLYGRPEARRYFRCAFAALCSLDSFVAIRLGFGVVRFGFISFPLLPGAWFLPESDNE